MDYLAILHDKDIFSKPTYKTPNHYEKRVTVKAVVRNEKGQFAFVTNPIHKFSRGDEINKLHTNGTGLGLYIAKQMIEAHKGTIGVNSEGEGKGSVFYIEIPTFN